MKTEKKIHKDEFEELNRVTGLGRESQREMSDPDSWPRFGARAVVHTTGLLNRKSG